MGYDYQTSLPAYKENGNHRQICQKKVLEVIGELGVCNDREIAEALGWEINRITPRRNELVALNLVECSSKKKDLLTGRTVNYWKRKVEVVVGVQQSIF